jgi:hypothetical protein
MILNPSLNRLVRALLSIILTLALPNAAEASIEPEGRIQVQGDEWTYPKDKVSPKFEAFPIKPGSSLSFKIDLIVNQILNTPTGRAFCEGVPEDYKYFSNVYFINKDLATPSFQKCKGHFGHNSEYDARNRTYYIAEDCKASIDGWTTYNYTMICLSKSDPDFDSKLTRIIIHEMIASSEEKQTFGNENSQQSNLIQNENSCRAASLYHNIQLQIALDTLRFYDIEKKLSEDLGLTNPPGFASWGNSSCQEKLRFIGKFTNQFEWATRIKFVNDQNLNYKNNNTPWACSEMEVSKKYSENIEELSQLKINFPDGHSENACDYLTSGFPFHTYSGRKGGPRPVIRPGGWIDASAKNQTGPNISGIKTSPMTINVSNNNGKAGKNQTGVTSNPSDTSIRNLLQSQGQLKPATGGISIPASSNGVKD